MEVEEQEVQFMQLKYCERCGGPWLRQRGSEASYCAGCRVAMSRVPVTRKRKRTSQTDFEAGIEASASLVWRGAERRA
jgi:hypothetical protein